MRSTSQRLYPNYANVDWSGNAGYDRNDPRTYFSTMGCRTANGYDINGLGQLKDGRGNICPTTIIMPTLAMEAGRDVEKFMKPLTRRSMRRRTRSSSASTGSARRTPRPRRSCGTTTPWLVTSLRKASARP